MAEEKKPRRLHVDTLHVYADNVVIHHEPREGQNNDAAAGAQVPQRDFWGFPIQQQQQAAQTDDNTENETVQNEQQDNTDNNDQGQQPPLGSWI